LFPEAILMDMADMDFTGFNNTKGSYQQLIPSSVHIFHSSMVSTYSLCITTIILLPAAHTFLCSYLSLQHGEYIQPLYHDYCIILLPAAHTFLCSYLSLQHGEYTYSLCITTIILLPAAHTFLCSYLSLQHGEYIQPLYDDYNHPTSRSYLPLFISFPL
jgi:preprotein translocase subunit Sec61beta